MTPLEWVLFEGTASTMIIIGYAIVANHIIDRKTGRAYEHGLNDGWYEGWDDREADLPRAGLETAERIYTGRHATGWLPQTIPPADHNHQDGTSRPVFLGIVLCTDPPAESCADAGCPIHGDPVGAEIDSWDDRALADLQAQADLPGPITNEFAAVNAWAAGEFRGIWERFNARLGKS